MTKKGFFDNNLPLTVFEVVCITLILFLFIHVNELSIENERLNNKLNYCHAKVEFYQIHCNDNKDTYCHDGEIIVCDKIILNMV